MTSASLVPLGLAGFTLPLITNAVLTTLTAIRIWYPSPRKVHDIRSAQFTARTSRFVIDTVVESSMLYLAVQFVFVILYAIGHPALSIVGAMAVQIYVRYSVTSKGGSSL